MKRYEYKFVQEKTSLGFNYTEKIKECEQEWNELGQQGWRYCKTGNGCTIFMREIPDDC